MKKVIITGDDFGLAIPVNNAIIQAHLRGILTTASLMVSAEASAHAIEQARAHPTLRVGLHLVLVEGRPVLPPEIIPLLTGRNGDLSNRFVLSGIRFFFVPAIRKQLEAEIRAQFEAFRRTGLRLDHANSHNHMHLHPTLLEMMIRIGKDYGLAAVRVPLEAPFASWRASRKSLAARVASWVFLYPWAARMRWRLKEEGLKHNNFLFGMGDSGNMTLDVVLAQIRRLKSGVTEIYFHPADASSTVLQETMPGYHHEMEYQALMNPATRLALTTANAQLCSYSDL